MAELYNEEGEKVEGALLPEEAQKLQEEMKAKDAELEKLQNKEFNFKKLRDMTDDERSKLTAAEMSIKEEQEKLRDEQSKVYTTLRDERKNDVVNALAGDDEELKKKILFNFDRIKDSEKALSKEDISQIAHEAYSMSTSNRGGSPINRAVNHSGEAVEHKSSSSKISDDAKNVGRLLGLKDDDLKDL
jgi:alanyl-tRNA synthetase